MGYVIAAVIVVLLVAGFVTFLVVNATSKSGPVADRSDDTPPGIGPDAATPLGDTPEHAEEHSGRHAVEDPAAAGHRAHPGEGEGEERIRFEPTRRPRR